MEFMQITGFIRIHTACSSRSFSSTFKIFRSEPSGMFSTLIQSKEKKLSRKYVRKMESNFVYLSWYVSHVVQTSYFSILNKYHGMLIMLCYVFSDKKILSSHNCIQWNFTDTRWKCYVSSLMIRCSSKK